MRRLISRLVLVVAMGGLFVAVSYLPISSHYTAETIWPNGPTESDGGDSGFLVGV